MWLSIIFIFTQGEPNPQVKLGPRFMDVEFCQSSIEYALNENVIPVLADNQYAEGTCYLYRDNKNPIIEL